MTNRKLDILVPVYNEGESVIKPLLDSIAIQQNCDFTKDIGVIICYDGGEETLSKDFLSKYPFAIETYMCEHRGVSATRQSAFEKSKADYVMYCDIDDMFYSVCAWYVISREIKNGFDSLVSVFLEETKDPKTGEFIYINHEMDTIFVHGKVHRRQYLVDRDINWNPNLTIHEDAYYNIQCQSFTDKEKVKYCPYPFYLWKWRDNSVCRHDPKYMLKTFNNMIEATDSLTKLFVQRGYKKEAKELVTHIFYEAYFTMNKKEWIDQENQQYRDSTEKRFCKFYDEFLEYYNTVPEETKLAIVMKLKNRMFAEGLLMESITFDDWIKHIKSLRTK